MLWWNGHMGHGPSPAPQKSFPTPDYPHLRWKIDQIKKTWISPQNPTRFSLKKTKNILQDNNWKRGNHREIPVWGCSFPSWRDWPGDMIRAASNNNTTLLNILERVFELPFIFLFHFLGFGESIYKSVRSLSYTWALHFKCVNMRNSPKHQPPLGIPSSFHMGPPCDQSISHTQLSWIGIGLGLRQI